MKLLMVDDEIFALKGILDSVDWSVLAFEEILTATSYGQAVNLFRQHEIAILICDIEMPMGNGLELVEWVNRNSPDTECIILSCHDEFDIVKQAVSLRCMDYVLKPVDPAELAELLEKAKEKYNHAKEQTLYVDYGKRYMEGLGRQEGAQKEDDGMHRDAVEETVAYIRAHIDEKLSVEELARNVYVSPDHLSRLFKKRYNKTLVDYITDERMTLAAEMLKHSSYSVSMISAKVGYPNYAYFTRQFKKAYGLPPRDYQKEHRE